MAAVAALIFSMFGWHRYTSIGFDAGNGQTGDRTETAIRFKWYGDGTVHLGAGHGRSPHPDDNGFSLDPAAAILDKPRDGRRTFPRSLITAEFVADAGVRDGWERWLVIPVWIPATLAALTLRHLARSMADSTAQHAPQL